jgi:hypothetical protein
MCLSTEIPSIFPRESGGTGFQPVLIKEIRSEENHPDTLYKEHIEKLRSLMAAFTQAGKPVPPA